MRILLSAFSIIMLTAALTPALALSYTAERMKCTHRSYYLKPEGGRRQVNESSFDAQIIVKVTGAKRAFSIDRYRWAPQGSYTRAMEQLNPRLPQSAPSTDLVSVGDFSTNTRGDRVSAHPMKFNRGRSYGSTIIREGVAVTINATDISIAVKERLTERWAGDDSYIRTVTCRFADANEAAVFMRATQ